ncbi:uncharacterized protein K02A2.6-like, partial [Photinus pyralis]
MTTSIIFQIEMFENSRFQWERWVKRLEGAFDVFQIEENKKLPYLLHYMGPDTYDLLCDKLSPNKPTDKTYNQVVKLLQDYYSPVPLEIAENFRFHQRKQHEGEGIQEFYTALQKLAIHCNFGDYQKKALRNQFVFGMRSEKIQNRLLETKDLTMDKAIEIAVGIELSARDTAQLHRGVSNSGTIGAVGINRPHMKYNSKKGKFNTSNTSKKTNNFSGVKCYRCGGSHYANSCDKSDLVCNFCRIKGHVEKVCTKKKHFHNADQIEEIVHIEESSQSKYREKFMSRIKVGNKNINFEVDSGAAVTIMGKKQFDELFHDFTIFDTNVKLISYCKTNLNVLGYAHVPVIYNGTSYNLNLYIVSCNRQPLLGREWIRQINLNFWEVRNVQNYTEGASDIITKLTTKYSKVFTSGIGKIHNIQARLQLKENTTPIFCKARSVPFALMSKVETEIDNLVTQGILTKVNFSTWATPIVPVVKANGKIRICGDFKVTLNSYLQVDEHPLPTIDELFSSMAGGEKFTKIDLSQAYLHLEVHPDDRHLLTLNTHKGLYQCNRLMFGIASAPAIWQRQMEKLLEGIPG